MLWISGLLLLNIEHIQCDSMVLPCQVLTLSTSCTTAVSAGSKWKWPTLWKQQTMPWLLCIKHISFILLLRYEGQPSSAFSFDVAKALPSLSKQHSHLQLLLLGMLGKQEWPYWLDGSPFPSTLAVQRSVKVCINVTLFTHSLDAASSSSEF